MSDIEIVDEWVWRLTGLTADRVGESRQWIESLGIDHLSAEMTRADIDAAAGSCMLKSAFDELAGYRVQSTKLEAKLRNDPGVWSSVTELIAVAAIAKLSASTADVELDGGDPGIGTPRPDLRLSFPDLDQTLSVEFKAIGLSAREVAFFREASEVLPDMVPAFGVASQHVAADAPLLYAPTKAERRAQELENRRHQKRFPAHIRGLNAAAVAAHFTEQGYLERVRDRILEAFRQLPSEDHCWVALWWSNGAPIGSIQQLLSTVDLPEHVLGVFLVGATVVVPDPEIHYFQIVIPRDQEVRDALPPIVSEVEHPFAAAILEQVEGSTGVRPTLIVHPRGPRPKRKHVLFRDGTRHIFPFNLLLAPDPAGVREAVVFEGSPDEEASFAEGILRDAKRLNRGERR